MSARPQALAPPARAAPGRRHADDWTVLLVPGRQHAVRRLRLGSGTRRGAALGLLLLLGGCNYGLVQYAWAVGQAAAVPALLAEHEQLVLRVTGLRAEVRRLAEATGRIEQMARRVQAITELHDPVRNLRIGPFEADAKSPVPQVLYAVGERIDFEDELVDSQLALRLVDNEVHVAQAAARRAERDAADVVAYLAGQPELLATTPSVRPVRSRLLSSRFGPRKDPFTGQEVMHKGVDFVADPGDEVFAPADGRVVSVGPRGDGYGLTLVLDHGYGVQTHFAHLARASVPVGDAVRRGQVVAKVGNSGRSTGAHLHYEVRFAGLPEDPERFILD